MRLTFLAALIPLALFTVACSGDDGPPLGGDVEGSWRAIPNATEEDPAPPVAERDVFTFNADGTMAMITTGGSRPGTYTVDGGDLTLTETNGTESHSTSFPYRATDSRFVLGALIPAGDPVGPVGTWTGVSVADGEVHTINVTMRADMTARYELIGAEEPIDYTGTWRAVGNDLELVFMPEPNFTIHMRASLVDGVLGSPFEKI